jgi:hypothetical protein
MARLFPLTITACLAVISLAAACAGQPSQPSGPQAGTPAALSLTSPAFNPGGAIPSLYALDIPIDQPGLDKQALLDAMQGHALATGELMGRYQK